MGNKIANKINSKSKTKTKKDKREEIYIPPEKRWHFINKLRF